MSNSKRTGLEELPREVHDQVEQRQCLHAVAERDEHEAAADGNERDGDQQVRLLVVPAASEYDVRQGQGRLTKHRVSYVSCSRIIFAVCL